MAVVAALMSTVSVVPQVPAVSMVLEVPVVSMVPQVPAVSMVSEVPVVSMVPQVPAVSMVSEVPAVSMVPQVMHTCTLALYQGLLPRSLGPRLICMHRHKYIPPLPPPTHTHTHFHLLYSILRHGIQQCRHRTAKKIF